MRPSIGYGGIMLVAIAAGWTAAVPSAAVELGPQGVVREFCQADALGHRLSAASWPNFVGLVEWPFEPAWDQVVLIGGYSVGSPQPHPEGFFSVDVSYTIVGQVSALAYDEESRIEVVTFRVHAPDLNGWRIFGAPSTPHLFANRVDVDAMRRSLEQAEGRLITNSFFVWDMYRSAGWNIPYQPTQSIGRTGAFRRVDKPAAGDLVVYLRDESPYHVGILEAEDVVVSSTLNAGIVRTAVNAFAGTVRYLRLVEPADATVRNVIPTPPVAVGAEPSGDDTLVPATERPTPVLQPTPKPQPTKRRSVSSKGQKAKVVHRKAAKASPKPTPTR